MRAIAAIIFAAISSNAFAQAALTDDQIRAAIIQVSRNNYYATGQPWNNHMTTRAMAVSVVVAARIAARAARSQSAIQRTLQKAKLTSSGGDIRDAGALTMAKNPNPIDKHVGARVRMAPVDA